ncbi:hypothetical protein KC871_03880 [Candidatus Saccharibacteria bacterium]|nr:hypothetical protein [Candidatus Saccharibacteria bacterium]MCB9817791.1 hypothetical protein [Candidatus Nomurabacteria bacterium]
MPETWVLVYRTNSETACHQMNFICGITHCSCGAKIAYAVDSSNGQMLPKGSRWNNLPVVSMDEAIQFTGKQHMLHYKGMV